MKKIALIGASGFIGSAILNEALSAFVEAKDLEAQIKHYTSEISKRTDYQSDAYYQLIHQLTDAN